MVQSCTVPFDRYKLEGRIQTIRPCGSGHINRTWRVVTDEDVHYLFQRVNTDVFPDIDGLMNNISRVTEHICRKMEQEGGDPVRGTLHIVPARDGALYVRTEEGCYRCYQYIRKAIALQHPRFTEDLRRTGRAFGEFQISLQDFPAETLVPVIPGFHNTPKRLGALFRAAEEDVIGRAAEVQAELDFIRAREAFAGVLERGIHEGRLPLRVTHNDTKLNNLLFDKLTMEPVAVIDLDTVMPGTCLYDFGDGIRFGAATAPEDERDLKLVECDMDMYAAFTRGWLEAFGAYMTPEELELLPLSPRVMTLECGARFLTDYLQGDTYFATSRPGQNLDRCRTQLKLVADMEKKEEEMIALVREFCK